MTTIEKANLKAARIRKHCAELEKLARSVGCNLPGEQILARLQEIERKIYRACERYSNFGSYGTKRWEADKDRARAKLRALFGTVPKGVYLNTDPRGHMLKLNSEEVEVAQDLHRDWGGDGILAPSWDDFSED